MQTCAEIHYVIKNTAECEGFLFVSVCVHLHRGHSLDVELSVVISSSCTSVVLLVEALPEEQRLPKDEEKSFFDDCQQTYRGMTTFPSSVTVPFSRCPEVRGNDRQMAFRRVFPSRPRDSGGGVRSGFRLGLGPNMPNARYPDSEAGKRKLQLDLFSPDVKDDPFVGCPARGFAQLLRSSGPV